MYLIILYYIILALRTWVDKTVNWVETLLKKMFWGQWLEKKVIITDLRDMKGPTTIKFFEKKMQL